LSITGKGLVVTRGGRSQASGFSFVRDYRHVRHVVDEEELDTLQPKDHGAKVTVTRLNWRRTLGHWVVSAFVYAAQATARREGHVWTGAPGGANRAKCKPKCPHSQDSLVSRSNCPERVLHRCIRRHEKERTLPTTPPLSRPFHTL
jgi:hypothetical protein